MLFCVKTLALEQDRQALIARLRAVAPSDPARWGRMSVHQMICHVGDAFRLYFGEKTAKEATGWLQSTVIKWVALYAPLKWPTGVPTPSEIDQCMGAGTVPDDFEIDRAETITLLEQFSRTQLHGLVHPDFGKLSQAQWLRLGYLHTDHHLRQFGR